jgi:putative aldouronate transport system permease protein
MSAISGIDQELYEAARLDGASRWQQVWYITLPGILPTVSICLIMALGGILGANTDLILNLYSAANRSKSDVIGTYVYRVGLGIDGGTGAGVTSFSSTGAIGLFSAIINITMLFIANTISNKLTDTGLW